jgi:mannose/cellobiose epimerase-like protein (N-acyl-D-glucosamine 2-epimerase family)
LYAAAVRLGLNEHAEFAENWLRKIGEDIFERRFSSDQYIFDPANRGGGRPGKFSQGPLMIYLGATALTKDFATAEKFISFIIDKHINHGQFPDLPSGCFIEALDAADSPWQEEDGKIICDPGHALEFTGLAARNLIAMKELPQYSKFVSKSSEILAELFCRVFDTGFQSKSGIMKAYDLAEGKAVNTDAPWWSLSESMRAAALLAELYPPAKEELQKRTALMTDAFFNNYISNGKYGFACQTCDVNGVPVDVIPAVPDADPLYHTNLPVIDIFKLQKS